MFAKNLDHITEFHSAATLNGQCGFAWKIRAGRVVSQRLTGLAGSALMHAKLRSRSFLGMAIAGSLVVSLACSSLGSGSDREYSAPDASSPPIYIQHGEGSNIAHELELHLTGTAKLSDREKGQLRALNIDDLNSSVGRNGISQPVRVSSVSLVAQVSKLPSPAATTVPTAKQSLPDAAGTTGQNPGVLLANSDDSDSEFDDLFESSVDSLIAAPFTGDVTAPQTTAFVVNVDDEDQEDDDSDEDAKDDE